MLNEGILHFTILLLTDKILKFSFQNKQYVQKYLYTFNKITQMTTRYCEYLSKEC